MWKKNQASAKLLIYPKSMGSVNGEICSVYESCCSRSGRNRGCISVPASVALFLEPPADNESSLLKGPTLQNLRAQPVTTLNLHHTYYHYPNLSGFMKLALLLSVKTAPILAQPPSPSAQYCGYPKSVIDLKKAVEASIPRSDTREL